MKPKILIALALASLVAGCSGTQIAEKAVATRPAGAGSVDVLIEGVSSAKGTVYGSIYLTTDGFPDDKEKAFTFESAAAGASNDGSILLSFPSIPAGWFVVAILHDKDGNEELSFNALGIPKEAYGFSRNPDSLFGPPDFDDAAVFLEAGESKQVVVTLE